jgi:hypothetical protein
VGDSWLGGSLCHMIIIWFTVPFNLTEIWNEEVTGVELSQIGG